MLFEIITSLQPAGGVPETVFKSTTPLLKFANLISPADRAQTVQVGSVVRITDRHHDRRGFGKASKTE